MNFVTCDKVINRPNMLPEEESLIQRGDNQSKKKENSIQLKYTSIIPAIVFLLLGLEIHTYVVNEWTQFVIRTDNFPNMSSISNFSACIDRNHSDASYKHYKSVQQKSAMWLAIYNTAQHIPMFFTNMILPSYTDTHGRRFLFLFASFGMLARYSIMPVIIYFKLPFLYVAAIYALDGFMGSSYALYGTIFSYIADITTNDNQRILVIVAMEGLFLITTVVSSVLTGYLIETWGLGFLYTGIISACVAFIGFFIFAFIVPESLKEHRRQKRKSLLATIKRSTEFYFSAEFKGLRLCYILLLLGFVFAELSGMNRTTLETLYFLGQPFCWGPMEIGVFSMARHASKGLIGICSLKLFQKYMSNQAIAVLSTLSNVASYIVESLTTTNLMIYMVPVTGMFSFLLVPMIRGMMSAMTAYDKQGALFASMAAIEVICSIISSYLENGIYAATFSFMNGFVFLVLALLGMINFILLVAYCCVKPYYAKELRSLRDSKYDSLHNTQV